MKFLAQQSELLKGARHKLVYMSGSCCNWCHIEILENSIYPTIKYRIHSDWYKSVKWLETWICCKIGTVCLKRPQANEKETILKNFWVHSLSLSLSLSQKINFKRWNLAKLQLPWLNERKNTNWIFMFTLIVSASKRKELLWIQCDQIGLFLKDLGGTFIENKLEILVTFWAIFKASLFKSKLPFLHFGQLEEKLLQLLIPTFGHTVLIHTDYARFEALWLT